MSMNSANYVMGYQNTAVENYREEARENNYLALRRAQDVILSGAALIALSPLLAGVALAIVLDDPKGGPIYTQTRCGKDGKEFKLYKFRSMCVNADQKLEELKAKNEMDGPVFKMKDDPRITRIGKFIRKCSIDELPQLVNILKGDMSIVGPRPALPKEVAQYNAYQRQRLSVTPGLTCIWQVQPNRNELSFGEWVELDLEYIKKRNLFLDWKLIFQTVNAVLCGYGE